MELRTQTLGDIATHNPHATRVFLRHRLDFCCGGQRTLEAACTSAGLDAGAIADEIAAASQPDHAVDWARRPLGEIVDHIERRYHEALRRDVPALIAAAQRVEKVHAAKPTVPAGLAALLDGFWQEMQSHMLKEETVLFPMLRRGAASESVYMPVRVMQDEHDAHGVTLTRIRALTGDLVTPPEACATWRALYEGLRNLEVELMEHIHLENNVVFLRAVRGGA